MRELGVPRPQDVREGASVGDDAGGSGRERPVERPVAQEDAGEKELGDDLDDAGTADACHTRPLETGLVRPRVTADDLYTGLERLPVDPHALDCPGRGPLAAADLRPLERGPGRARRREQPLAVPEHDLGVRPDVDDQRHPILALRGLGEDHSGRVGADVTRDARQDVRARALVHR